MCPRRGRQWGVRCVHEGCRSAKRRKVRDGRDFIVVAFIVGLFFVDWAHCCCRKDNGCGHLSAIERVGQVWSKNISQSVSKTASSSSNSIEERAIHLGPRINPFPSFSDIISGSKAEPFFHRLHPSQATTPTKMAHASAMPRIYMGPRVLSSPSSARREIAGVITGAMDEC